MDKTTQEIQYADKVRARVKPMIVYGNTEHVNGNPSAIVLIELNSEGRVKNKELTKSSGISSWDLAVMRAIDRVDYFPKDSSGYFPKSITLVFTPKDNSSENKINNFESKALNKPLVKEIKNDIQDDGINEVRKKLEEERRQLAEERRKLEEEKRKYNSKPPVNTLQDNKRQKCLSLGLTSGSSDFQQCMK